MRFMRIAAPIAGGLAVLATGTAMSAAPTTPLTCAIALQSLATPAEPAGEEFGTVSCSRVFGDGVQHDVFEVTPTSETAGLVHGRYTQYFETGTIHGEYDLTFEATSATTLALTGTATIGGGTGAYKHSEGSATLSCTSRDGITHTDCTETATLTHR